MSNLINILLQAEISPKAITHIQEQINSISANSKPIQIKFDVDKTAFKFIEDINKTIVKNNTSLTPKIDTSGVESGVSRITNHLKGAEKQASSMTKTTKEGFQTIREEIDLVNKTPIKTDITYDYEKERKARQKVIDDETKRRREARNLARKLTYEEEQQRIKTTTDVQAKLERLATGSHETIAEQQKRVNQRSARDYEQVWLQAYRKQEQSAQTTHERVGLFQQKMLGMDGQAGQLDIFAEKYKGKFDTKALQDIRREVDGLFALSPKEQEEGMKRLNIQFGNLRQTAQQSGSVLARTFENMSKFLRFYVAGGALVGFVREIRSGIQSVKDLDTSLTELNKISGMSSEQMKLFTDRAYDAGVAIARTGKEVVDATVEWRRAGYAMEEAFELAQKSLLLTNVGSGIDDVVEASSSMIAILKGFKMEAEDATHIVDALNEVSNNYALDTVNLTEILKRVSGTMAQTGTSYEQLIGLSVGAFESLRNSEKVASGLNMITQRLKGMSESGEEIEGLIPKIQSAFDKYAGGAVQVIDKQNGSLNSTYEILSQLEKVYPSLTDEARAYINEAIAGNRQNVVLTAIMENWENVENAIESATNSLGSAEKSNAAYLDSIEGRTKELASTTQLFWKNFIDSDLIKNSISLMTALVSVFDKLINNSFTQGIIVTGLLAGAIVFLNSKLTLLAGTTVAVKVISMFKMMTTSAIGFSMGIAMINSAILASPLLAPALIIGGIVAIVKITDKYSDSLKNLNKRIEETTSALDGLQSEYDSLKAQEDLTEEQKVYLQLLEKEIERKEESLAIDKAMALQKEFLNKETVKGGGYSVELSSGSEKIHKSIESLEEYRGKLKDIDIETEKGLKQWKDISKKIKETEDDLDKQLRTIMSGIEALEGSDINFLSPEDVETLQATADAIKRTLGIVDELADGMDDLAKATNNTNDAIQFMSKSVSDLYSEVSNAVDNHEILTQALKELNEEGKISKSTYEKLIEYSEDFAGIMGLEKDAAYALLTGHQDKTRGVVEALITEQEKVIESTEAKIDAYETELMMLDELLKQRNKLAYLDSREGLVFEEGGLRGREGGLIDTTSSLGDWKNTIKEAKDKISSLKGMTGWFDSKGKSSGSSSSKDSRQYLESMDAEIRAIKIKNDNLIKTRDLLDEQLKLAKNIEGVEGLNEQYRITGEIIAHNEKVMQSFKEEQDLVHARANEIREQYSKYNIDSWFDSNAEQTTAYIDQYNSATKDQQEEMSKIFGWVQALKKAWSDANGEVKNVLNTNKELEKSALAISKNTVAERLANSKDWIEKRKFYDDWGADNEIAAWERVKAYIQDYYKQGVINHKEYTNYMLEIDRNLANERQRIADESARLQEEKVNKQQEFALYLVNQEIAALEKKKRIIEESAEKRIKAIETTIKLLQERLEIVKEEQEELQKLQDRAAYIVNQEINSIEIQKSEIKGLYDAKISAIQDEIDRLEERNDLLEEEENRQKKLFDIADQKKRLENTLKERNVRILQDGEWTWVADPKKVADETEKLKDLQEGYDKWESDLAKQKEIKGLRDQIKILQEQQALEEAHYDNQIFNLQEFVKEHTRITHEFYGGEVRGLEGLMDSIKSMESGTYVERMDKLKPFLNQYLNITKQSRLDQLNEEERLTNDKIKEHNKRIEKIREETSVITEQLNKQVENLNLFISEYNDRTSEFYGQQITGMSTLLNQIKNAEGRNYEDRLTQLGTFVSDYLKLASQANVNIGSASSGSSSEKSLEERNKEIMDYNERLAAEQGVVLKNNHPQTYTQMKTPSGAWASVNDSYIDKYLRKGYTLKHKGGVVGDGSRDLPEVVNKLFNTKPDEQMVKALKGELFIPEENIFKNFLPNMQSLLNMSIPNIPSFPSPSINKDSGVPSNTYNVQIDKIETPDAQSFVEFLPSLVKQYK